MIDENGYWVIAGTWSAWQKLGALTRDVHLT